jgi:pSer/pThr/pTyr-binding forkhead associated (FHA) protein
MSATVTLTVASGSLAGKRLVFREAALCTLGRAADCEVRISNAPEYLDISRHHCLLDVAPPKLWVYDFDSLNGTYVNGVNIGQRMPEETTAAFPKDTAEHDVHSGDEIRVGHLVFRVSVDSSATYPDVRHEPCEAAGRPLCGMTNER